MNKKKFFIFLLLMIILHPMMALSFKYAFLYQKPGDSEFSSIGKQLRSIYLAPETLLKIFIRPQEKAYIYIYLYDTQDNLSLLFPEVISDFDKYYHHNKNYHIPEGNECFVFDDSKGTDRFYLLVSEKRLPKLEKLTQTYMDILASDHALDKNKSQAKQEVINEIRTLRLSASSLKSKESIHMLACDFRGLTDQREYLSIGVESQDFYTKTIRIDH